MAQGNIISIWLLSTSAEMEESIDRGGNTYSIYFNLMNVSANLKALKYCFKSSSSKLPYEHFTHITRTEMIMLCVSGCGSFITN